MRLKGARGLDEPLSAQAHAPNRPSGADKKEVQNEGESRPGLFGLRSDRAIIAADRHFYPRRRVPRSRRMVNGALTAGTPMPGFLAEVRGGVQGPNGSAALSRLIAGLTCACALPL